MRSAGAPTRAIAMRTHIGTLGSHLTETFFKNISKRISRTKNEIAVPASLHSIRELSAKEKNRRRIEEQREAQHFEYVKRSGSLKHAEIRPQRSAYQGIRYGPYHHKLRLKFAKS